MRSGVFRFGFAYICAGLYSLSQGFREGSLKGVIDETGSMGTGGLQGCVWLYGLRDSLLLFPVCRNNPVSVPEAHSNDCPGCDHEKESKAENKTL